MGLVALGAVLDQARANGCAVGAFNVSDLVQAEAVLDAGRDTGSPVVLQVIAGSSAYDADVVFWRALRGLIEHYDDLEIVLHLDHGRSVADCVRAIGAGFTSVMIDGSVGEDLSTPNGLAANIDMTAEVVDYAHARGVSVEAELGTIGGVGDAGEARRIVLADPSHAREFVRHTHVDALAIAIGTSHGAVKETTRPEHGVLALPLIGEFASAVPAVHLVMHGSSSLPAALRQELNRYGGSIAESWGPTDAEKVEAIRRGIRKINQGVDSQLAYTVGLRRYLHANPQVVDPAPLARAGASAMRALVAERMRLFGAAAAHR